MNIGSAVSTRPTPSRLTAVADLARARQALLSVAQPGLGALIAAGGVPSTRVVVLGSIAATTGYLAVFSLNDVLDRKVDAEALEVGKDEGADGDIDTISMRHPLARGALPVWFGVAWVTGLAAVAVAAAWSLDPMCVALFGGSVSLEIVYCSLRRVTYLKTLISGVMVGLGGLAGWVAVAPLSPRALPFFAFLALWEIAGRNVPNDLADMKADAATGLRTVATVLGPRASVRSIALGALGTLALLGALQLPPLARLAGLGSGVLVMGAPVLELSRTPSSERAAAYFNRASLLPALVFAIALGAALLGAG